METADTSAYNAHNLSAYKDVPVPSRSSVRPDGRGTAATATRLPHEVLQNRRDRLRDRSSTIASQSSAAQVPSAASSSSADHVDHRHRRLDGDPVGERVRGVGGVQVPVPAVVAHQLGERIAAGQHPVDDADGACPGRW